MFLCKEKVLRIESPLSDRYPCTTAPLESRSFDVTLAAACKPTFRSNSAPPPSSSGLLWFATSAIASCVSGLPHVTSQSSEEEKKNFLAWVEWLPVTSRSHVTDMQTHSLTVKCKIKYNDNMLDMPLHIGVEI